jgi:hypothetical protein
VKTAKLLLPDQMLPGIKTIGLILVMMHLQ